MCVCACVCVRVRERERERADVCNVSPYAEGDTQKYEVSIFADFSNKLSGNVHTCAAQVYQLFLPQAHPSVRMYVIILYYNNYVVQ